MRRVLAGREHGKVSKQTNTKQGTGKIWYENLTGGIRDVAKSELPKESNFGFEIDTFIVNVTSYLPWYVPSQHPNVLSEILFSIPS